MEHLTDPNPYEVLQIGPDADRQTIKRSLANRQRENKSQVERQKALKARNELFSTEARLVVDSFVPNFAGDITEDVIIKEFGQESAKNRDWLSLLDEKSILQQDLQAYLAVTVRHTLGNLPPPSREPQLLTDFDGLAEFLTDWLK